MERREPPEEVEAGHVTRAELLRRLLLGPRGLRLVRARGQAARAHEAEGEAERVGAEAGLGREEEEQAPEEHRREVAVVRLLHLRGDDPLVRVLRELAQPDGRLAHAQVQPAHAGLGVPRARRLEERALEERGVEEVVAVRAQQEERQHRVEVEAEQRPQQREGRGALAVRGPLQLRLDLDARLARRGQGSGVLPYSSYAAGGGARGARWQVVTRLSSTR